MYQKLHKPIPVQYYPRQEFFNLEVILLAALLGDVPRELAFQLSYILKEKNLRWYPVLNGCILGVATKFQTIFGNSFDVPTFSNLCDTLDRRLPRRCSVLPSKESVTQLVDYLSDPSPRKEYHSDTILSLFDQALASAAFADLITTTDLTAFRMVTDPVLAEISKCYKVSPEWLKKYLHV